MQKIISVSSFGASLGNSANLKQSPPRLTSSLGLFTTCSALGKPTTESVFDRCDEEAIKRAQYRLRKQAALTSPVVHPLRNAVISAKKEALQALSISKNVA